VFFLLFQGKIKLSLFKYTRAGLNFGIIYINSLKVRDLTMRIRGRISGFLKQRNLMNFYKKFIRKGDLCFDIGANTGGRTDLFLRLGAKVVAVEPQSRCFEMLQKRFAGNRNLVLVKAALGSSEREEELMLCNETNECATFSRDFADTYAEISKLHWTDSEMVHLTTLDKLCSLYGMPDYCKIDVEGYESEVFSGLHAPIRHIEFEFNKPLLKDTVKCLEILGTIGKYHCNFIKYEIMKPVLANPLPVKDFRNRLPEILGEDTLTGEILLDLR
jgi:FkbM family methyltransferase